MQSSASIDATAAEAGACLVCGATRTDVVPPASLAGLIVVRCLGCGLAWSRSGDPATATMSRAGRSRERSGAVGWAADLLHDVASASPGRGQRLRMLCPLARPLAAWLLDVVVPLDGRSGLRVLALDDAAMVTALAARGCVVTDAGDDVAIVASAGGPGASDGVTIVTSAGGAPAYDAAVVGARLADVSDPLAALRALAARLRPGARVHLVVSNLSAATPGIAPARWFFDAASLVTLVEAAGLTVVRGPIARGARRLGQRWLEERRHLGVGAASRRLAHCLAVALRTAGSGELLRLGAERR